VIFGIGTDVVRLDRVEATLARFGEHFVQRLLLPEEEAQYRRHRRKARFLAMRFAGKEAVVKAMGTGFRQWHVDPRRRHRRRIRAASRRSCSRRAAGPLCEEMGIGAGHVSLTDEAGLVVAVAVLHEGRGDEHAGLRHRDGAGRRISAAVISTLDGLSDADVAQAMFALRRGAGRAATSCPCTSTASIAISCAMRSRDGFRLWSLGDADADEAELVTAFLRRHRAIQPGARFLEWLGIRSPGAALPRVAPRHRRTALLGGRRRPTATFATTIISAAFTGGTST
jgi:holo-[acyl-carrier protein] synthase